MLKSFASGISSVKGSPLDKDKLLIQATTKNSPFCEIITKTPIDKKKIFGSLKQTSSSLLRKAQAMNKPIHSNRKLFENGEDEKLSSASNQDALHILNKENNWNNGKVAVLKLQSPIPTVKGSWNWAVSPKNGEKTVKIGSPDSVYNKSPPLVLYPKAHWINLKSSTQFGTPQNGLKGSLIASSTWGSTQINFGNMRNTILMKSNEYKSRNAGVEDFSSGINYTDQKETLKSLGFKSRQISPTNTQSLAS